MISLQDFINANTGKANVGDTPENTGQCVGLVEVWTDNLGLPHTWGNAADLMANADPNSFDIIQNTPTGVPQAGDIICWSSAFNGTVGHTGIFVSGDASTMQVFEQNDPLGSTPHIKQYNYTDVQGWLHPKVTFLTSTDLLQECLAQHDQLVTKCDQQSTTIDNLNQIIKDKDSQISGLNTKVSSLESQVKDLQTSLDSKTPIAEQLPQCQKDLEQAIEDRKGLTTQIQDLNKKVVGLSGTSYKTVKSKILVNELIKRALQRVGLA